jgi:methionine-rich copper-binding protein CopC
VVAGGVLGTVAALVLVAGPVPAAQAHSRLVTVVPAAGSTVRQQPTVVRLTFSEQVRLRYSTVVVTGAHGAVSRGTLSQIDSTISRPIEPVRSGMYTVAWRVVSADGHPVSGRFAFRVALPPGAEPALTLTSPTPVAAARDAGNGLKWVIGVVFAVAAIAAVAVVAGRRRMKGSRLGAP